MSDQTTTPSTVLLISFAKLKELGWPFTRAWTMKLVAAGRFPAPIKVSARTVRWRIDQIDEHIDQLPTGIGAQRGRPAKRKRPEQTHA